MVMIAIYSKKQTDLVSQIMKGFQSEVNKLLKCWPSWVLSQNCPFSLESRQDISTISSCLLYPFNEKEMSEF